MGVPLGRNNDVSRRVPKPVVIKGVTVYDGTNLAEGTKKERGLRNVPGSPTCPTPNLSVHITHLTVGTPPLFVT